MEDWENDTSGHPGQNGTEEDPNVTLIKTTTFISSLIMLLFCCVGFYGNVMSIVVFSHPTMRAPINVVLTALSYIDSALIISSIFVYILPSMNVVLASPYLHILYIYTSLYVYPLCMTAHTCSLWTFVLVSVERYLAVCEPLKRHKLLTCREARFTQIILAISALSYNLVRFWEFEQSSIGIVPLLRKNNFYFLFYYISLYVATHFVLPFGSILILNIFIIRSLRSNLSLRRKTLCRFRRQQVQQRKTTQMMIVITLVFALCNTPAFLINVLEALVTDLFYGPYQTQAYIALDISNILVVFNSSSTFLFYMLYCRKYRMLFAYVALQKRKEQVGTPTPILDRCTSSNNFYPNIPSESENVQDAPGSGYSNPLVQQQPGQTKLMRQRKKEQMHTLRNGTNSLKVYCLIKSNNSSDCTTATFSADVSGSFSKVIIENSHVIL